MSRNQVSQRVSQNTRKIPPGTIAMWPSNTIPNGWLLCDGSIYDQLTYPALFAVIAENYTSGDYPQLPDLRTRIPYATGSIATTGGQSTVTLTAAQSALISHTHTFTDFYPDSDYNACSGSARSSLKEGAIANETSTGVYVGTTSYPSGYPAQAAHTNLQPYLLLNFIIKY
jgi:microcystin-dependent protein